MSLMPDGSGMHHSGGPMWHAIEVATDNTARTIRLIAVLLTFGITSTAPFLIMSLVHGWLW